MIKRIKDLFCEKISDNVSIYDFKQKSIKEGEVLETSSPVRFINCEPTYIKGLRLNPDKFYH